MYMKEEDDIYEEEIDVIEYSDDEGRWVRAFCMDDVIQSASYTAFDAHYDLVLEYTRKFNILFDLNDHVRKILMVGGGTCSYPKYVISHYPDVSMDVIEKNSAIIDMAVDDFYLDELMEEFETERNGRLNIFTEDGRSFLENTENVYDAVINDAFSGSFPIPSLITLEAAERIHAILSTEGVFIENIGGDIDLSKSEIIRDMMKTLAIVFTNVQIIPAGAAEENAIRTNYLIIATNQDVLITDAIPFSYEDGNVLTDANCEDHMDHYEF